LSQVAPDAKGNGAGMPKPVAAITSTTTERPREAPEVQFVRSFSQIVAVMMRDPNFRNLRIADLEWLVLPPAMAGQFRLALVPQPQGKTNGQQGSVLLPVAVALWAAVSEDIDKALSESRDEPARLRPDQWASGDKLWLMAVAGDQRAIPTFLKQLAEKEFKGRLVKMRTQGSDGKIVVKTLGQLIEAVNLLAA
jgi:hemolysin-activating ACP:hemolysin acyltransferase